MADYYPLLARAVTGLQSSTPETRQAIYDRARDALLGQLRGITPPVPDQDIERERIALDVAVKRLEDELAVDAARRRRADKKAAPTADAAQPAAVEQPDPIVRPRPADGLPADEDREKGRAEESDPAGRRTRPQRRRIERMHPAAPTPQVPRQSKARIWIFGATIVAVVAMIGVTAYFLREVPEDLASSKPPGTAGATVSAAGKIDGRIGSEGKAVPSSPVPAVPVATVPIEIPKGGGPPKASPARPQSAPAVPANAPPGQTGKAPSTAAPNPGKPPPTIPVAYRAALLVQGDQPSGDHKTYVGTVLWRLDSVTGDPGQPLQTALRADVDIPDAKLKVSMQMQKNTDPALSASHTMVLGFVLSPGGAIKGVRSIDMPHMRDESSPNGTPLIGIGIVPITPTYFLVGLQQGDQNVTRNFDLLKQRNWIDVQFVLDDGRAAKITFEKGAQGEQDLVEAIAAWK